MAFYGALFGTPCSRSAPSSATTASSSPSGQSSAEDLVVVVQFHGQQADDEVVPFRIDLHLYHLGAAGAGRGGGYGSWRGDSNPRPAATRHVATVGACWPVLSWQLRSGESSSRCAPDGSIRPWWIDIPALPKDSSWGALGAVGRRVDSAHGGPFQAPAGPGQSRGDRVRPDPVLQRRRLRHRHHPADRRPASARRRPPAIRPATPPRHPQIGGFAYSFAANRRWCYFCGAV